MANRKKVNTLDLIQQMTQKNKETLNTVADLKQERTSSTDISKTKQHLKTKSVVKEVQIATVKDIEELKSNHRSKQDRGALQKLKVLLETETFIDRKETFTSSLSKDCLAQYEKLATGISYKSGIKTTRNKLMRKVLEDFIKRKYIKLLEEIELQ